MGWFGSGQGLLEGPYGWGIEPSVSISHGVCYVNIFSYIFYNIEMWSVDQQTSSTLFHTWNDNGVSNLKTHNYTKH